MKKLTLFVLIFVIFSMAIVAETIEPKNELLATANDALGQFVKDLQSTKEFVIKEAPLVIQELYAWYLFKYRTFIIIGIICGIIALISLAIGIIRKFDNASYWLLYPIVFGFLLAIILIPGGYMGYYKIIIAPKLFLLEHITNYF